MGKRVIAILTAVVILLCSSVVPVEAAQTVNYTVYAFVGGNAALGTQSIVISSLSGTVNRIYGSAQYPSGGYSIAIPANNVGGYLIVVGYRTIAGTASSGWSSSSAYSFTTSYYIISDDIGSVQFSGQSSLGALEPQPFTGILYIPPHSNTLYLNVFGALPGQGAYNYGAYKQASAIIQFVPDSSGGSSDVVAGLQQVNQSIQNVYNEIHSSPAQDAESQQMLEELEKLSDQIEELSQQPHPMV